jgi:hypothetical protein
MTLWIPPYSQHQQACGQRLHMHCRYLDCHSGSRKCYKRISSWPFDAYVNESPCAATRTCPACAATWCTLLRCCSGPGGPRNATCRHTTAASQLKPAALFTDGPGTSTAARLTPSQVLQQLHRREALGPVHQQHIPNEIARAPGTAGCCCSSESLGRAASPLARPISLARPSCANRLPETSPQHCQLLQAQQGQHAATQVVSASVCWAVTT